MPECDAVREAMPALLLESLESDLRERSHLHIEGCEECALQWENWRLTWTAMDSLHDVPVPTRLRVRFLDHVASLTPAGTVVPMARPRPVVRRWLAQAAAMVILVGGSFYAGHRTIPAPVSGPKNYVTPATVNNVSTTPFSIAESQVVSASQISPDIEGRPQIRNVRFLEPDGTSEKVAIAFDMTSHVTVTGRPDEKGLVRVLSYVLQNQDHSSLSKSNAMAFVKETYSGETSPNPDLVRALANVLKNDTHEGARIKAVEALRSIPPGSASAARSALVEALKNDPNPAVRIKAIDALANLAKSGESFDSATVDLLRQKAGQNDENLYVRVKAAEALGQINL
ncbi:MAG: HEAT repeat domain-containing protein [Acidobacteriota bacterium]